MKKISLSLLLLLTILLPGCLDLTQEITIREDGSGVIEGKMDLSAVMAMLAQMGGTGEDQINVDSTVSFQSLLDSANNFSEDEKALLKDAVMGINVSSGEEKFIISTRVPFSRVDDIEKISALMDKWDQSEALDKTLSEALGDPPGGNTDTSAGKDDPFKSMPEDYFNLKFSDGKISRSLKKDKYAMIGDDQALSKMKEASEMGGAVNTTLVLHLPRPVKNFSGKNVKLSDDKMKVTVQNTLDDLFDDASKFEFSLEY